MSQSNNPIVKVREPWIDNVKALAILFVIIGHSIGLLSLKPESMSLLGAWIVAFNMPLFVIMAGWTSYKGLERITDWESLLVFLEKLFERTVLPPLPFPPCMPWRKVKSLHAIYGRYISG